MGRAAGNYLLSIADAATGDALPGSPLQVGPKNAEQHLVSESR